MYPRGKFVVPRVQTRPKPIVHGQNRKKYGVQATHSDPLRLCATSTGILETRNLTDCIGNIHTYSSMYYKDIYVVSRAQNCLLPLIMVEIGK